MHHLACAILCGLPPTLPCSGDIPEQSPDKLVTSRDGKSHCLHAPDDTVALPSVRCKDVMPAGVEQHESKCNGCS